LCVSFVGYIAIRIMGDQTGIVVASIAGGVTSSTATTLSFARLARDHPEASSLLERISASTSAIPEAAA
jgi:uncharacterized membrane protein (DUF4010 family)